MIRKFIKGLFKRPVKIIVLRADQVLVKLRDEMGYTIL